jgi:serine/threonine protein kinase
MKILDSIVERCLDNNPNNRYQSIEEIKNEISKYNAQTKRKIVLNEQIDKSIDAEEIKEKLIDVLDNICGTDEKNKKFESYNKLNDEEVEEFLERLGENLNKLQFFNDVGMSRFINKNFYDHSLVNKMYYEELDKLYNQIKREGPELKSSFIEYVKLAINSNVYELPF